MATAPTTGRWINARFELRLFALNVGGKFFPEMGWDARLKVDLVALLVFLVYLANGADSGQGLAVGLGNGE